MAFEGVERVGDDLRRHLRERGHGAHGQRHRPVIVNDRHVGPDRRPVKKQTVLPGATGQMAGRRGHHRFQKVIDIASMAGRTESLAGLTAGRAHDAKIGGIHEAQVCLIRVVLGQDRRVLRQWRLREDVRFLFRQCRRVSAVALRAAERKPGVGGLDALVAADAVAGGGLPDRHRIALGR
jgi:hypothetical protein